MNIDLWTMCLLPAFRVLRYLLFCANLIWDKGMWTVSLCLSLLLSPPLFLVSARIWIEAVLCLPANSLAGKAQRRSGLMWVSATLCNTALGSIPFGCTFVFSNYRRVSNLVPLLSVLWDKLLGLSKVSARLLLLQLLLLLLVYFRSQLNVE